MVFGPFWNPGSGKCRNLEISREGWQKVKVQWSRRKWKMNMFCWCFFASFETRESRLRENRPQTHPLCAKKGSQNQHFQILCDFCSPNSWNTRRNMCVSRCCNFRRKVRNLEFPGRNKPMLRPLFATLRFPVFGHGWKCCHLCFKMIVQIDFRPIACEDGSKKYQYSMG